MLCPRQPSPTLANPQVFDNEEKGNFIGPSSSLLRRRSSRICWGIRQQAPFADVFHLGRSDMRSWSGQMSSKRAETFFAMLLLVSLSVVPRRCSHLSVFISSASATRVSSCVYTGSSDGLVWRKHKTLVYKCFDDWMTWSNHSINHR